MSPGNELLLFTETLAPTLLPFVDLRETASLYKTQLGCYRKRASGGSINITEIIMWANPMTDSVTADTSRRL